MFVGPVGSPERKWVGREWLPERFAEVSMWLSSRGIATVLVGDERRNDADAAWPNDAVDLRGRTSVAGLAYVIKHAELFVGLDSFPMHIAQAFGTPGVCYFGAIRPELRIYRENMAGITAPSLPCLGCHHEHRVPTIDVPPETTVCKIGGEPCRTGVSAENFIQRIEEHLTTKGNYNQNAAHD
jgi:ADP-heptose:LPS heptosyltransferase